MSGWSDLHDFQLHITYITKPIVLPEHQEGPAPNPGYNVR